MNLDRILGQDHIKKKIYSSIEKNKYPNLILNKDDKVEIVQFIGGG